jgi:histidine triad (HIT) family protein
MPARVVHADASTVAFLDIHPVNRGHLLVVPRTHAESLVALPEGDAVPLWKTVARLAGSVTRALGSHGFNLVVNNGRAAGQVVPHVHVHIIPRFEGDGVHAHPPTKSIQPAEMDDIQRLIQEALVSP